MNNNYIVIATYKAKPGKFLELRQELLNIVECTRKEVGCISYSVNESLEDNNTYTIFEKYKNKDAFELHCKSTYILNFKNNLMHNIVELPRTINFYREL